MADAPTDTNFFQRPGVSSKAKKVIVGGGTGLSAAALIYIYSVFATKSDLDKVRAGQSGQWQQLSQLREKTDQQVDQLTAEINELRGRNAAYEMLLRYITNGTIYLEIAKTNR